MDKFNSGNRKKEDFDSELKMISKMKKLYAWGGVALIFVLVFGGIWFLRQPQANANSIFPGPFYGNGGCCGVGVGQGVTSQPRANISCGIVPGGGCGSGTSIANVDVDTIKAEAEAFYANTYGEANVEAVVTDYGCHIQADIYKDGQLIKSLGYSGPNQFYEIN